ncbi:UDP-N-acetylglucosamine 1-carboxyvinyltransferase [soil metagenome]
MDKFIVHGGNRLKGTVTVSGSKNSSLPILAATLLTRDKCVVRHVPDVSDTNYMLAILRSLGADVERASGTVTVEAKEITSDAPYDLVRKMRASICVMGPLVGRLKRASVSLPGGCVIGDRPVDLHLKGIGELGADVQVERGNIRIEVANELVGKTINLRGRNGSTVLGTDNLMMAAVLAKGTTVIDGAAAEPEVVDLANFLIAMGAKIEGAGTKSITIEEVDELHGCDYTVIPDRIEAGTYLAAGAIAGGEVTLKRVERGHLESVIDVLEQAGCQFAYGRDSMTLTPPATAKPCEFVTAPYPGFPTDMQAQMCALLATTPGISAVTEAIFPQRFMHLAEMSRMGADVKIEGATAVINGVKRLSGAPVMASDLRASAALVLAGLMAKGQTEILRVYHIDRGYENIDEKLMALGADIERVKE